VLKAIDELGYRPDAVARYLRTGKTRSIGLVLPDIGVPYFSRITQRITEVAMQNQYQVLVATSGGRIENERMHLEDLSQRRVDGIILMSIDPMHCHPTVDGLGASVIVIDRPVAGVLGAVEATRHLVEHGRTRIAHLAGPPDVPGSVRHRQGWTTVLQDHGLPVEAALEVHLPLDRAGGYRGAQQLFSMTRPPDGIVVDSDAQAAGVLRAAHDMAVRIPEDVGIITFDATEDTAPYSVPSLTSVDSPLNEIAEQAVETLLAIGTGHQQRLVDDDRVLLVRRESCGCSDPSSPGSDLPTAS